MIKSTTSIRVRYGETDQMGIVYHGNYPAYFELGRIELFREIDLPYKDLEESGVLLPVIELHLRYIKSAFYDDILTIETQIKEIPKGVRFRFDYKITNQNNELLTEGYTLLAFVDKFTRKPVRCPEYMLKKLEFLLSKNE
ncbi:MAG: thioesterase family protein [Weeksellaceae bacterium]|jgi:acyl-CoA thioester hydrolase|nr:thioesterase family protein [Weeksellaceae bacterium]